MKLILSRKGFDSSAGGTASPIHSGMLLSLPIPDDDSPLSYSRISICGVPIGPIVRHLTKGVIKPSAGAHLDPDLDRRSLPPMLRLSGWRAAFGATGPHQKHLENQGVDVGDLFLFFGWFRDAHRTGVHWSFNLGSPDRHILFGWLQIGRILNPVTSDRRMLVSVLSKDPWLKWHPNLSLKGYLGDSRNTIYIAKTWLSIPGLKSEKPVPGFGLFAPLPVSLQPKFVLTQIAQPNRSTWRLSNWNKSSGGVPPLSFHGNAKRWTTSGPDWIVRTVGRGQEFVVDTASYPDALAWAVDLFADW